MKMYYDNQVVVQGYLSWICWIQWSTCKYVKYNLYAL